MAESAAASFVYLTAPNKAEALRIGRALVEERLAACINVIDGMTSVYRWQGNIEESSEAVLIGKVRSADVPAVVERVKALHSDSCPCVVGWPLERGNPDFLAWIADETRRD